MELSTKYLGVKFNEYNKEYFSGVLKFPRLIIIHTKSHLGLCGDGYIKISDYFDADERFYCQVLLHEMIHLYIIQKRLKDNKAHGRLFYSIAERINKQGGWEIARCNSVAGLPIRDKTKKWHVCAYQTQDKRYFMYAINKKYLPLYERHMRKYYNEYKFFVSDNSRLCSSLCECRRLIRGKFIDKDTYDNFTGHN